MFAGDESGELGEELSGEVGRKTAEDGDMTEAEAVEGMSIDGVALFEIGMEKRLDMSRNINYTTGT